MRTSIAFLVISVLTACGGGDTRVVVAAGTTLVDSGLIDIVATDFETEHPGVDLSVVGDASAAIITLARNGAADVTLTHTPDLEAEFIAEGGAGLVEEVFSSRFVLVGPPQFVGPAAGMTAPRALQWIVENGFIFVSRADGSGTYRVEARLWAEAGINPSGASWYVETGQGMGPTLQVASERSAFTLAELGSFVVARDRLGLADAGIDPAGLVNPYVAMAVAESPVLAEAEDFVAWLASDAGLLSLARANRELFGEAVVYEPGGTSN